MARSKTKLTELESLGEASEYLRLMQRCGFFTSDKDGRRVFCRVTEPHLKKIPGCIEDAVRCGIR